MYPHRFDRLSKSFATRLTRRGMLAGIGAGGVAAAAFDEIPSLAAPGGRTCIFDFDGTIDIGPSSTISQNNTVAGELTITIGVDGAIDSGTLVRPDGTTWPVVGQADGRAVSLRFSVPNTGAFVAVGTGRHAIASCTPAMAGPASGPLRKDAGSWSAKLKKQTSITATATTAALSGDAPPAATDVVSSAEPTDEPTAEPTALPTTASCQLSCANGSILDPASCTCGCPAGVTACGDLSQGSAGAGMCVDLLNDVNNCGACGQVCTGARDGNGVPGEHNVCVNGVCETPCLYYIYVTCSPDAVCKVNLQGDNLHCGTCDNACSGATPNCVDGVCACRDDCTGGTVMNAGCTQCVCLADTTADSQNCGACGHVCPVFAPFCNNGTCIAKATGG